MSCWTNDSISQLGPKVLARRIDQVSYVVVEQREHLLRMNLLLYAGYQYVLDVVLDTRQHARVVRVELVVLSGNHDCRYALWHSVVRVRRAI